MDRLTGRQLAAMFLELAEDAYRDDEQARTAGQTAAAVTIAASNLIHLAAGQQIPKESAEQLFTVLHPTRDGDPVERSERPDGTARIQGYRRRSARNHRRTT